MTKDELRASKEYAECIAKIKGYSAGFEFNVPFYAMSKGQQNAMRIILADCVKAGLIENISFDLNISLEITEERYKRL